MKKAILWTFGVLGGLVVLGAILPEPEPLQAVSLVSSAIACKDTEVLAAATEVMAAATGVDNTFQAFLATFFAAANVAAQDCIFIKEGDTVSVIPTYTGVFSDTMVIRVRGNVGRFHAVKTQFTTPQ